MSINQPLFNRHTGNVLDFDFNPFHDNIIASASEDTSIKVRSRWVAVEVIMCYHEPNAQAQLRIA